jgi:hypothetical protein
MEKNLKFRFLNSLLASGSPFANDICADAAKGIGAALESGDANMPLEIFAKRILRLYDPNAHIEVLDFENGHFDPLFAVARISEIAKRMSGYERGILVVSSLDRAGIPNGGRMSPKRKSAYASNIELVENYLLRYENSFSNVEIIFI